MKELKSAVSTQTKIKVVRAIEAGIRHQSIADTMGLPLERVREIRTRSNADIKAVTAFLQTASVSQKKLMAHAVRSCGGNELSSRRESLGISRQTLRQWILAAEMGLLGEYYPADPFKTAAMSKNKDKKSSRSELEAKIKELEDTNILLRAECDYLLKKKRSKFRWSWNMPQNMGGRSHSHTRTYTRIRAQGYAQSVWNEEEHILLSPGAS